MSAPTDHAPHAAPYVGRHRKATARRVPLPAHSLIVMGVAHNDLAALRAYFRHDRRVSLVKN